MVEVWLDSTCGLACGEYSGSTAQYDRCEKLYSGGLSIKVNVNAIVDPVAGINL